eukprot:Pgem_evm1s18683
MFGGPLLPNIGAMTWLLFFQSYDMNSCSCYNPTAVQGTLDISMGGVPNILKGSVGVSYIDLYGEDDDPNVIGPWGRLAIPAMNLNYKEDGNRVIKGVNITIKVYDRIQPFTAGHVYWKLVGDMLINVDLGLTYHYTVNVDKNTLLENAQFNSGPFSEYNPNAQIDMESPYSFFTCIVLDFLPQIIQNITSSTSSSSVSRRDVDEVEIMLNECNNLDSNTNPDDVYKCYLKMVSNVAEKVGSLFSSVDNNSQSKGYLEHGFSIGDLPKKIQEFTKAKDKVQYLFGKNEDSDNVNNNESNRERRSSSDYTSCNISGTELCDFNSMTSNTPYLVQPNDERDGIDPRCLFDDINGNKVPYQFTVNKGSGDDALKVLLYFQGGGADWNEVMNDPHEIYNMAAVAAKKAGKSNPLPEAMNINTSTTYINPPALVGVYDKTNPKNPFKDWTHITVTYCSGDAHVGNYTLDPLDNPNFPRRNVSLVQKRYRHGYSNTMSVINWIQDNIQKPELLTIMGCSAGSLGAQIWTAKAMDMLQATSKNTQSFFDSYVGVFPANSYLPTETGKFSVMAYNGLDILDRGQCHNVSETYVTEDVLSAPIGSVVNQDWALCQILSTTFKDYVSTDVITDCYQNKFDIHNYFNEQFNYMNGTVHFINSKADQVQREFAMMVGFTVGAEAGLTTSTDPTIQYTTSKINCSASDSNFTYCEELASCTNGGEESYTYYNNMTYTIRDQYSSLYLVQILKNNFDAASLLRSPMTVFTNKLIAEVNNYFMQGGVMGQDGYWNSAQTMIKDYSTTKKSWYFVNANQHCYTCYDLFYDYVVNEIPMVDWVQNAINNLEKGNEEIVTPQCDVVNGDYPVQCI